MNEDMTEDMSEDVKLDETTAAAEQPATEQLDPWTAGRREAIGDPARGNVAPDRRDRRRAEDGL